MAIRSVFYRFCLKKAQVPNVPNGGCFYEKRAFGSKSLEACVKNGWVPNVPNGLGNSKGLRARKQRPVAKGWGGGYRARQGRIRSKTHIGEAVATNRHHSNQKLIPPPALYRPPCIELGVRGTQGSLPEAVVHLSCTRMLLVSSNGLATNRHVDRLTLRYTYTSLVLRLS